MQSTVSCLLEAEQSLNITAVTENMKVYDEVQSLDESSKQLLGFTLEKVSIHNDEANGRYLIEYSNNLERYMQDQALSLESAIDNICKRYTLFESDIAIVVDESCVDKIDMPALVKNFTVYKI